MQHFIIRNPDIRTNAVRAVSQITQDPLTEVIIRLYKKSKSQEQLGYLFGVVLKMIQEHIEDSTGEHYTTDELYGWFIEKYGEAKVVTIGKEHIVTRKTASKMNTKEMHDFIERVIQHAATKMDLVIPDAQ